MSAWRLRIAIAAAPLPLLAACAAVLGIDDLPLAVAPPEPPPTIVGRVPDPPDACDTNASFCVRTCPAFVFCDDFESETNNFELWKPPSVIPKPLKTGAFATTMGVVPSTPDRGVVLAARAESNDNGSQTLALVHAIPKSPDGRPIRGLHARVRGQLAELAFSPLVLARRQVGVFGVASTSVAPRIAVFMMYDRGENVGLGLQQRDPFGQQGEVELFTLGDVPRTRLEREWPEIEVIVGFKSALVANGFPCPLVDSMDASSGIDGSSMDASGEAGTGDPMVGMMRIFGLSSCVPLVEDLAARDWIATPLLFAGVFVTDYGTAKFLFDDVGVRYLF